MSLQIAEHLLKPEGTWLAEPVRDLVERQTGPLTHERMRALSNAWFIESEALLLFADSGSKKLIDPKHGNFIAAELAAIRSAVEVATPPPAVFAICMRLLSLEVMMAERQEAAGSRISRQVSTMALRLESVIVPPDGAIHLLPETAIRIAVEIAKSAGIETSFGAVKKYRIEHST